MKRTKASGTPSFLERLLIVSVTAILTGLFAGLLMSFVAGCSPGLQEYGQPGRPVIVTWDAPTLNADGTELTDLAGYRVYAAAIPGEHSEPPLDETESTSASLALPYPGSYIVVTAIDESGNESDWSEELEVQP